MDFYDRQKGSLYWLDEFDPTMRQKMAFISGHFLLKAGARVADMGCGWGEGSFYLATLNPHIEVVGVDNDPARIEKAKEKYGLLSNLSYVVGNIERPLPEWGSFDGFLNSSVLHHVYSYNGYRQEPVLTALRNQFAALNPGGVLAVRDFVAWPEDRYVYLDLKENGGGDTPQTMSEAELLVLFSKTARSLAAPQDQGFFLEEVKSRRKKWRRFYLPAKWAAEFALRKDYRRAWENEAQEEYSFWSPEDYARVLSDLGGRLLYHGPFWNRWIVANRFEGKLVLRDERDRPLDFPPTNYVALVEKTEAGAGLCLAERGLSKGKKDYLTLKSYRNAQTGRVYDMAARPGGVVDCLPYFEKDGTLYVAAKNDYPRPLVNAAPRGTARLDGKRFSGHLIEPVALANVACPADILAGLEKKAGLCAEQLREMRRGLTYYTEPGLADEIVESVFVRMEGAFEPENPVLHVTGPDVSGFSASGDVRFYRAQELLRAAQVGILPEARLELSVYALLRNKGLAPEAWLDGKMERPEPSSFVTCKLESFFSQTACRMFAEAEGSGGYIEHVRSLFEERSGVARLAARAHEFVLPAREKGKSANAVPVILLAQNENGELCLGVKPIDLPAPQRREGDSRILVAPIYRLPFEADSFCKARSFLAKKTGCPEKNLRRLGEGFYSSIGMMTEKLYPYVAFVEPNKLKEKIPFVALEDFFGNLERLRDAPLMIGGLRAIHALGVWKECSQRLPRIAPR